MSDRLTFDGFRWGTATSAHQVECHLDNDWSVWEEQPGKIVDGTTSNASCGWWEGRYAEDFAWAQEMCNNSLRLSIEWSRIEPQQGQFNGEAVARYRAMLQSARDHGLEPMVTLLHFTVPRWVAAQGGWANPATIGHFERFVRHAVPQLGDLVDLWCTINEPNVYAVQSYLIGLWPPQHRSITETGRVLKNLLLAHAHAYLAIHELQSEARVGLAQHIRVFDPLNPRSFLDRWFTRLYDRLFNDLVLIFPSQGVIGFPLGFHEKVLEAYDTQDFIGLNHYSRDMISFDIRNPAILFTRRQAMPGAEYSMEGWGEVYPEGLYRSLKWLAAYNKPIYITEFGIPDNKDAQRPRMLLTHLAAAHRALSEGVPVKGAYFWSLVDNFEWADGFAARFGLVGLDVANGQRTLKPSGELYREICCQGAITREMVERYAPEAMAEVFPN